MTQVVLKEEVPRGSNVRFGHFGLVIGDPNTKEGRRKARFIDQGHRDRDKTYLVHSSPNLKMESVRLVFALASIMGFEIWTHDITQAYLQGSIEVMRDTFLDPRSVYLNSNQIRSSRS